MPLFKPKPDCVTYFFSSDNFRETTIRNPQTNETYWIEKNDTSQTAPSYLWKPSTVGGGPASRKLIATSELQTWGSGVAHITYHGVKNHVANLFPWTSSGDGW
ncbi:hypothetical protein DL93DRAFT_2080523 [Clavulina sp. PMI_390]|nr:hypothetical protein DL93DRAFT_2080523 [Clavulina sp. PMI_390]